MHIIAYSLECKTYTAQDRTLVEGLFRTCNRQVTFGVILMYSLSRDVPCVKNMARLFHGYPGSSKYM